MTPDELIEEGRRLQRRTVLLSPGGAGDSAAVWYGHEHSGESADGHQCWISVAASAIPSFIGEGWLSIFTNEESREGGRVDVSSSPYRREGVRLFPKDIAVLPPIAAVIARGSSAVGQWLADNGWQRNWPYNSNFRDHAIVEDYQAVERRENPLYWKGAYATLGGWHMG